MRIGAYRMALASLLCATPVALHAQFAIEGRPVQIHGFASQGFTYSNDNNYLTMKTSEGSFVFTGARAGKVKTTLGLYTDTQDMEFLHTWAILPQSLYPLD